MEIHIRNLGDQSYEVLYGSVALGKVYRMDSAWSYAPWMIEGDHPRFSLGGVNNQTRKRSGYVSRKAAIKQLAVMQSSIIISPGKGE